MRTVSLAGLLALVVAAPSSSQTLASRLASVATGEARFTFASRAGVCGDGRSFVGDASSGQMHIYLYDGDNILSGTSPNFRTECLPGPVRVSVIQAGGRVTMLQLYVGGAWTASSAATDIGNVPAPEAASYLLSLAESAQDRWMGRAFLGAMLADSVRLTERLIAMANNRQLRTDVRARALRWLPTVGEREGTTHAAELAMRHIIQDGSDVADVRERAIRELPSTAENDAFLRGAYPRVELYQLQERIVRRLGEAPTQENVNWLQALALNAQERLDLRERALRVLGDDMGRTDLIRTMYPRVAEENLKERIIRIAGQAGDPTTIRWLEDIAENQAERVALRDRALRELGEQGQYSYLQAAYARLNHVDLQERVVRLVGESGSREAGTWLQTIALDRNTRTDLRDRAIRMLGDQGLARGDALRTLYTQISDAELRDRLVRLAGEQGDEESLTWLATLSMDATQPEEVRDRAIRVLAEQGRDAYLRDAYSRVDRSSLRDRILRSIGERGGTVNTAWLMGVARDEHEDADLRDRAVRVLAEVGVATGELVKLYDGTTSRSVRERLIRIFAERGSDDAIDKLIAIARNDPDADLRRSALRRLGESRSPRARQFLEGAVKME